MIRRLAFSFAALALVAAPAAAQTGPYCPANVSVSPGTCICPAGLAFRMHTTATNQCASDGQCVCPSGTWNGQVCAGSLATSTPITRPATTTTTTGVAPSTSLGVSTTTTTTTTRVVSNTEAAQGATCTAGSCSMGQVCAAGYCVLSGPMRYTLTWSPSADLDLQVVAQGGITVDAQHRQGGGGVLDRDDRTGSGPENVFWADAPEPGHYSICVAAWGVGRPVSFDVQVALPDGSTQHVRGTRTATLSSRCAHGSPTNVATVTVPLSGRPVVTPPTAALPNIPALATASSVSSSTIPQIGSGANQATSTFPNAGPNTPGTTTTVVVVPNASTRSMSFDVRLTAGHTQPSRVAELRFLAWNRQPFSARIEGTTFVIAPNGDFSRSRRDQTLQFISWDGQRSSAQVNGVAWTVHPTTSNDLARYEPVLPFVQWDGQRATAQIVP